MYGVYGGGAFLWPARPAARVYVRIYNFARRYIYTYVHFFSSIFQ